MGINLITDDLVNANAKAQFYNTTPATADGSLRVLFDTTEFNDNDIFVLDTVNREVVCNFNGVVQVNVDLSASSGTLVSARISLNNSAEYATGIINSGGSRATSSAMVAVSSGDRISVKDSGGATYGGAIWDMKLDIARVADYSAGSAAGFGLGTESLFGLVKPEVSIVNSAMTFQAGGSSNAADFYFAKIKGGGDYSMVTMHVGQVIGTPSAPSSYLVAPGIIPVGFRPFQNQVTPIFVANGGVSQAGPGSVSLEADGDLFFYKSLDFVSTFSGALSGAFNGVGVSWITDQ